MVGWPNEETLELRRKADVVKLNLVLTSQLLASSVSDQPLLLKTQFTSNEGTPLLEPFFAQKCHRDAKANMELANLPPELLMHIAKALDRDRDIYALCRLSRRFFNLIVGYLYRHNASASNAETSAILWAAKYGQVSTAEKALQAGVDINLSQNSSGSLPLVEATRFGNANLVRLFLNKGAEPNVLHGKAGTILHTAAARWDMATATALLEHGANPNAQRFDNGETPLHTAINSGAIMTGGPTEMIKLLLDHGADSAGTDFVGATPLHCAAACGNIAAIHTLLDSGADTLISIRGSHTDTPLHSAIRSRNEDAAKVLIDKGADIEAGNDNHHSPFFYAVQYGCPEVARILLDKGAGIANDQSRDEIPLVLAASGGKTSVVKLLLEYGADVEARSELLPHHNALTAAAEDGHFDTMEVLLDAGADVNATDEDGLTILHGAVLGGYIDMIMLLVRRGADIDAKDDSGTTPLHYATHGHRAYVVEVLVASGANVAIQDSRGWTALDIAVAGGINRAETREVLERHIANNMAK